MTRTLQPFCLMDEHGSGVTTSASKRVARVISRRISPWAGNFSMGTNWADVMTFPSDVVGPRAGWHSLDQRGIPFRPAGLLAGIPENPPKLRHPFSIHDGVHKWAHDHDWKSIQRFGEKPDIVEEQRHALDLGSCVTGNWSWNQSLRAFPTRTLGHRFRLGRITLTPKRNFTFARQMGRSGRMFRAPWDKDSRAKSSVKQQFDVCTFATYGKPVVEGGGPASRPATLTSFSRAWTRTGHSGKSSFEEVITTAAQIMTVPQINDWTYRGHDTQIGDENNWLDFINSNWWEPISLKSDSTLWKWNFDKTPDNNRDVVYSVPVTVPRAPADHRMTFSKVSSWGDNADWVDITTHI